MKKIVLFLTALSLVGCCHNNIVGDINCSYGANPSNQSIGWIFLSAVILFALYLILDKIYKDHQSKVKLAQRKDFEAKFNKLINDKVINGLIQKYYTLHKNADTWFIQKVNTYSQLLRRSSNITETNYYQKMISYDELHGKEFNLKLGYFEYLNAVILRAKELGNYEFASKKNFEEVMYYCFYSFAINAVEEEYQANRASYENENKIYENQLKLKAAQLLESCK